MFELLEKYYRMGIYTKANVAAFVASGSITGEQYREITGEQPTGGLPAERNDI